MGLSIDTRGTSGLPAVELPALSPAPRPERSAPLGPLQHRVLARCMHTPSSVHGFLKPAVSAVVLGAMVPAAFAAVAPAELPKIEASPALKAGAERLLALDADHDGKVIRSRFAGDEIGKGDALSKAIFAFVDYVNPNANTSLWGSATTGDYQEGGLGLGFTTRPKHMTSHGTVLNTDIAAGVKLLDKRLDAPLGDDAVSADLGVVLNGLKGTRAERLDAIASATEKLLDHIKAETEKKELATGSSTAVLTEAELLAGLPAGSLERAIAEAAQGHGPTFFAGPLAVIAERGLALGLPPRVEKGVIGEAQQNYLLVLQKRAIEARLIGDVAAALKAE